MKLLKAIGKTLKQLSIAAFLLAVGIALLGGLILLAVYYPNVLFWVVVAIFFIIQVIKNYE